MKVLYEIKVLYETKVLFEIKVLYKIKDIYLDLIGRTFSCLDVKYGKVEIGICEETLRYRQVFILPR